MSASTTSLMKNPGKIHSPLPKAALNFANEISEEIDLSNIQMMNGISTNIRTPLTRCRMETMPAGGKR